MSLHLVYSDRRSSSAAAAAAAGAVGTRADRALATSPAPFRFDPRCFARHLGVLLFGGHHARKGRQLQRHGGGARGAPLRTRLLQQLGLQRRERARPSAGCRRKEAGAQLRRRHKRVRRVNERRHLRVERVTLSAAAAEGGGVRLRQVQPEQGAQARHLRRDLGVVLVFATRSVAGSRQPAQQQQQRPRASSCMLATNAAAAAQWRHTSTNMYTKLPTRLPARHGGSTSSCPACRCSHSHAAAGAPTSDSSSARRAASWPLFS
jgi:hypothetical protein